jgi:hypothetical protein
VPLLFPFPHDGTSVRIAAAAVFARGRTVVTQSRPLALEVSGIVDDAAPEIDAAFDIPLDIASGTPLAPMASPGPRPVAAYLRGFGADGRTLFSVPLYESGSFRALIALEPTALDGLTRLELIGPRGIATRTAGSLARADLEVISVDPEHVLVKWNARAVPVLRIRESARGPIVAVGAGDTTFSQISLATTATDLAIELSDGLHSATRVVHVFGR